MKSLDITLAGLTEKVSTLAVEWIEMPTWETQVRLGKVSTLAVEWIEIGKIEENQTDKNGLHPRGGVD